MGPPVANEVAGSPVAFEIRGPFHVVVPLGFSQFFQFQPIGRVYIRRVGRLYFSTW